MTTQSFSKLDLGPAWLENLERIDYTEMTAIQAKSLPVMLDGGDVIGQANTGTGKTAAFGLALLSKIEPASQLPGGLVLCPTRELATQVTEELRRLAWALPNTNVVTICGGRSLSRQKKALRHGVDVVVGTPGRILDHIRRETLNLSNVSTLVFDEADRMLEMGFIDDVSTIAGETPRRRQTHLFSATIPNGLRRLTDNFQRDATHIKVVDEGATPDIEQSLYDIGNMERLDALERLIGHYRPESAVIFCNQRDTCDEVAARLRRAGHDADSLHGGMEQRDRDHTMIRFGNGSLRLLAATNVAARGIDIDELDAVINYELPRETKTFVHRIGRTGRAGEEGMALTLVSERDEHKICELDEYLGHLEAVPATELSPSDDEPISAEMTTLAIRGGRKDKLRPGDIVGAFTGDFNLDGDAIGLIQVKDRITFVAVDRPVADKALRAIENGQIKNRSFRAFMPQ